MKPFSASKETKFAALAVIMVNVVALVDMDVPQASVRTAVFKFI